MLRWEERKGIRKFGNKMYKNEDSRESSVSDGKSRIFVSKLFFDLVKEERSSTFLRKRIYIFANLLFTRNGQKRAQKLLKLFFECA